MTSINVMPNNMPQISDKICKRAHAVFSPSPLFSFFMHTMFLSEGKQYYDYPSELNKQSLKGYEYKNTFLNWQSQ